jgi:hypothetical protein
LRAVQRTGGIERGSAEWRRVRKGFRVFRASVFPRCRCPLNSKSPLYWGGGKYNF